ncbi:MAG: hypothetical protein HYY30_12150, partial [Chloroflexi bacterium]|nr:hypothetical protein [Chloroflexota bacterium]
TIYDRTGGTGGTETLNVSGTGRYVRIYGTSRGQPWWGYSLWEFEVHGSRSNRVGELDLYVFLPMIYGP